MPGRKRRPGVLLAILPPDQGERKAVTASGSKGADPQGCTPHDRRTFRFLPSAMQNSPLCTAVAQFLTNKAHAHSGGYLEPSLSMPRLTRRSAALTCS
jgi:hypothetical protein